MNREMIDRLKILFDLNQETNKLNRDSLIDATNKINFIITEKKYNNSSEISKSDVEFTDNFFKDKSYAKRRKSKSINNYGEIINQTNVKFFQSSKLSKILFDIYYPVPSENSFYHYTKISALKNILKGELKLKSLITNENYEEFKSFYTDHNMLGYFEKDIDGKDMNESLMSEIYTFCMASKTNLTNTKENSLWNSFGDSKKGVRIDFNIESEHCDFRKIFYKEKGYIILPFKNNYATFKINKIKIGEHCTTEQIELIKSLLKENDYSENIIE